MSFFHILPTLTRRQPLRKKLRMRLFFDVSKVKESSFLIRPHCPPPLDYWCASFGKYQFYPFQLSFSVGFYNKICFESDGFIAHSNEWDLREKNDVYSYSPAFNQIILYKKVPIFSDE